MQPLCKQARDYFFIFVRDNKFRPWQVRYFRIRIFSDIFDNSFETRISTLLSSKEIVRSGLNYPKVKLEENNSVMNFIFDCLIF